VVHDRDHRLRPLADWDDDRSAPPGIYWWSRLDERYLIEARRLPARRVLLVGFDHLGDDVVIGRSVVDLIGEPRFGPDPDDVYAWQRLAEDWLGAS
jgi:hypothetical protein